MAVRFLVGERLYFRPVEEADLPQLHAWINDPDTRVRLGQVRPMDLKAEQSWWEAQDRSRTPRSVQFAVCLNEDDALLGTTGLHIINWLHRWAESGTLLGPAEARGRGYGTEAKRMLLAYAFDTLNLHKVMSRVYEDNEPSLRHLLRCGFREEGRLRQQLFRDGRYHDELVLGCLADEWRAAHSA
ncbi:MAG: N-acetyltransferase [Deltaproteobacteria bacterium]|nr:MAG: N-acetyltransferase [Deltaproteobacteria bacterium]